MTHGEFVGDVEVEALGLVDVALANAGGTDAPLLVEQVGGFVDPEGLGRKGWGYAGEHGALLLFKEETFHHWVNACRGACNDARAAGRSHGKQVGIAHTVGCHLLGQRLPTGRAVTAFGEVGARLPVAALEVGVAALFASQLVAGLDGGKVDLLKELVDKLQVLFAFPTDAA